MTVAQIHLGLANELTVAYLDTERDWGHAADFVKAMRLMLQRDVAEDLVLATGETHSVRDFIGEAFRCVGICIMCVPHFVKSRAA